MPNVWPPCFLRKLVKKAKVVNAAAVNVVLVASARSKLEKAAHHAANAQSAGRARNAAQTARAEKNANAAVTVNVVDVTVTAAAEVIARHVSGMKVNLPNQPGRIMRLCRRHPHRLYPRGHTRQPLKPWA